jgi:hypothetical protein
MYDINPYSSLMLMPLAQLLESLLKHIIVPKGTKTLSALAYIYFIIYPFAKA